MHWQEIDCGDPRGRALADLHYTRQRPGHPMWTRPGWRQILYYEQKNGRAALWCWWRPKWEAGIERKDRFRCIECTMFRNQSRVRSSVLIREAVAAVLTWRHAIDTEWPDGLVSGVNPDLTAAGRAPDAPPGRCFLEAGWRPFVHPGKRPRAKLWLRCQELPATGTEPRYLGRDMFRAIERVR